MTTRSVVHTSFVIDLTFDAPPAAVFDAYTKPERKERWFTRSNSWPIEEYSYDFRVGGHEHGRFSPDGTTIITNNTTFCEIVPDERVICAYTMAIGGAPISSSLGTTEFFAQGRGTRLVYTEQAAFLDGKDQCADREGGCRALFESLRREVAQDAAPA
jgi:uncharacterized protein YndB with AHSA1/START domain